MSNKILVLGSTGKTGRRIAERLTAKGIDIRKGSRKENPSFDWDDSSNWEAVLTGTTTAYISFQPDLAVPAAVEKISQFTQAAKAAKLDKLVLLSGRGEKEAEECEQLVIHSGLHWTILRASWFMQNFSESFLLDGILANEIILPVTKAKEPFIDVDDIADAAVAVLTSDDHNGKIYQLTGPALLSFEEATAIIAKALNREINYTGISMEEYVEALRSYQLPEDYVWLIKYLFSQLFDGRNESTTNDVEKILGRKPASFDQYVEKTIKTGVWKIQ